MIYFVYTITSLFFFLAGMFIGVKITERALYKKFDEVMNALKK